MWDFPYDDERLGWMRLEVKTAATGTFTTARLCEKIRSTQYEYIREKVECVTISWTDDDSDCSDSDLEAIGNAFHDLPRFYHLHLLGCWPDAKASALLRHVPKTKIHQLSISEHTSPVTKFSSVMAELQRGGWLASLQCFCLDTVVLDKLDCDSLGQLLRSRQQEKKICIMLDHCTFPSFTGYLVVADGLIESGRFYSVSCGNTVSDATIPSYSISSTPQSDFYNRYKREDEEDPWRFNKAARNHLAQYSDLNDAGRSTVICKENTDSVQHWVDALCHDEVRNNVDYLFHFVSSNPNMYATAASSNDNDNDGLAFEQGSVPARVKRRRRR